jgi:hypothetical protein
VLLNAVPVRMCVEGTDLKLSDGKRVNDIRRMQENNVTIPPNNRYALFLIDAHT